MRLKKSLAILLSLAVLVGLVPLASMAFASASTTTPVTEITFDAADETAVLGGAYDLADFAFSAAQKNQIKNGSKPMQYIVSFNYYLEKDVTVTFTSKDGNATPASATLQQGQQTFSQTFTVTDANATAADRTFNFTPVITAAAATKLCVWDLQVQASDGSASQDAGSTVDTSVIASDSTATITNDKMLSEYGDFSSLSSTTSTTAPAAKVWEIDFSTAPTQTSEVVVYWMTKATPGTTGLALLTKDAEYTYSFDYYLEADDDVTMIDATSWGTAAENGGTAVTFSEKLTAGKGNFSQDFTATTVHFFPGFQQNSGSDCGKLYIWNFAVTKTSDGTNVAADLDLTKTASGKTPAVVLSTKTPDDFVSSTTSSSSSSTSSSTTVTSSSTQPAGPVVTEIEFAQGQSWVHGGTYNQYSSGMNNTLRSALSASTGMAYTITFDYYLDTDVNVSFESVSGYTTPNQKTDVLEQGKHTLTLDVVSKHTQHYQIVPKFTADGAAKLYVWNVTVAHLGNELSPYSTGTATSYTTATVSTSTKTPDDFPDNQSSSSSSSETSSSSTTPSTTPSAPAVKVWEIDFSAATNQSENITAYWQSHSSFPLWTNGAEYTYSFDYYLEDGDDVTLIDATSWGRAATDGGSAVSFGEKLTAGKHTFSMDITAATTHFFPGFQQTQGKTCGKLYIWNYSLVKKGETTNLFADLDMTKNAAAKTAKVSLSTKTPDDFTTPSSSSSSSTSSSTTPDSSTTPSTSSSSSSTTPSTTPSTPAVKVWKIDFSSAPTQTSEVAAYWKTAKAEAATKIPLLTIGAEYTYSFDYYLEAGDTVRLLDATSWGQSDTPVVWGEDERDLTPGKGTMTKTFTATTVHFFPAFQQNSNEACGDLYIWNVSLVKTGDATNTIADLDMTKTASGKTPAVVLSTKTPDDFSGGSSTTPGSSTNPGDSSSTTSPSQSDTPKGLEDLVHKISFSKYDFTTDPEGKAYKTMLFYSKGQKMEKGKKYTISFDYAVMGEGIVKLFNPYANWSASYGENEPGTMFVTQEEYEETGVKQSMLEGPKKGQFTFTFTASAMDAAFGKGLLTFVFENNIDLGQPDFYFWNFKFTVEGSDANLLTSIGLSDSATAATKALYEVVDIDPSTLVPGASDDEDDEDDDDSDDADGKGDGDDDDADADDDDTDADGDDADADGDDDEGESDFSDFEADLTNEEYGIVIDFGDASFEEDTFLDILPLSEDDLAENILEAIGDYMFYAYDIALGLGEDFFYEVDGEVRLGIPVPEDFDPELVCVYATNEYGDLIKLDIEVIDGMAYFSADILGTFVMVEDDLGIGMEDGDDGFDDEDYDEDGDSPDTGDNVVGVVVAMITLLSAFAVAIVSKKRIA